MRKSVHLHQASRVVFIFCYVVLCSDAVDRLKVFRSGLCFEDKNVTNCAKQLPPPLNENPQNCVVRNIDEEACMDLDFPSYVWAQKGEDIVKIRSYFYNDIYYHYTAFNTSLTNSHWKDVTIKFRDLNREKFSFCRQFTLSSAVVSRKLPHNIFFDCIWNISYSGEQIHCWDVWEHTYFPQRKWQYCFKVPLIENIDPTKTHVSSWEVFMYVHIHLLPELVLTFQKIPNKFKIQKYHIELKQKKNGVDTVVQSMGSETDDHSDLVTVYFGAPQLSGYYYFTVQPLCESDNYSCAVTKSIMYHVQDNGMIDVVTGLICTCVMICLLLIFGYVMWKWQEKRYQIQIKKGCLPNVLLVYSHCFPEHMTVMKLLEQYLEHYCYTAVMNIWKMNSSKNLDPYSWCSEAVQNADFFIIIASPQLRHQEYIYKDLDGLTIALIKSRIQEEITSGQRDLSNYSVVVPSYCSSRKVPKDVRLLRKYKLMDDFKSLLCHIHKIKPVKIIGELQLPHVALPGCDWNSFALGRELEASMKKAEEVVNREAAKFDEFEYRHIRNNLSTENCKTMLDVQEVSSVDTQNNQKRESTNTDQLIQHYRTSVITNGNDINQQPSPSSVIPIANNAQILLLDTTEDQKSTDDDSQPQCKTHSNQMESFGDVLPCVQDLVFKGGTVTENVHTNKVGLMDLKLF